MKKFLLFLACFVFIAPMVLADIGPKPSMDVSVRFEGQPISDAVFLEWFCGASLLTKAQILAQVLVMIYEEWNSWVPLPLENLT